MKSKTAFLLSLSDTVCVCVLRAHTQLLRSGPMCQSETGSERERWRGREEYFGDIRLSISSLRESALNKTAHRRADVTGSAAGVNRTEIVRLLIVRAKSCDVHPTGGAVL